MFNDESLQPLCQDLDPNLFFDSYEESILSGDNELARSVDRTYCFKCPLLEQCLTQGIKTKSTGVWGGVYLDEGKVSKKFNRHKSALDWQTIAENITDDSN